MYSAKLAADGIEVPMQPGGGALSGKNVQTNQAKDRPSGTLPHSVTDFDAHHMPKKVIQIPGVNRDAV